MCRTATAFVPACVPHFGGTDLLAAYLPVLLVWPPLRHTERDAVASCAPLRYVPPRARAAIRMVSDTGTALAARRCAVASLFALIESTASTDDTREY